MVGYKFVHIDFPVLKRSKKLTALIVALTKGPTRTLRESTFIRGCEVSTSECVPTMDLHACHGYNDCPVPLLSFFVLECYLSAALMPNFCISSPKGDGGPVSVANGCGPVL